MDEMPSEEISPKDMLAILQREDHTYGTANDADKLFKAADTDENGVVSFEEMLSLDGKVIVDTLGDAEDPAGMGARGLETAVRRPEDYDPDEDAVDDDDHRPEKSAREEVHSDNEEDDTDGDEHVDRRFSDELWSTWWHNFL